MAFQPLQCLAALHVPEPQRLVRAEGEDLLAVRREDARRLVRVPLQLPQFLAGVHVPQPHRLVVAPGKEPLAVRRGGELGAVFGMADELAKNLVRGDVPEVQVLVPGVAGDEVFAAGHELRAGDPEVAAGEEFLDLLPRGQVKHSNGACGAGVARSEKEPAVEGDSGRANVGGKTLLLVLPGNGEKQLGFRGRRDDRRHGGGLLLPRNGGQHRFAAADGHLPRLELQSLIRIIQFQVVYALAECEFLLRLGVEDGHFLAALAR